MPNIIVALVLTPILFPLALYLTDWFMKSPLFAFDTNSDWPPPEEEIYAYVFASEKVVETDKPVQDNG